jgi:cell fate regulator YaaT (PSP1 superfamily)
MTPAYVVRYGRMRFLGAFSEFLDREHPRGRTVVVRGERGVELGEVLAPVTERTEQFLKSADRGEILRTAEAADLDRMETLSRSQAASFATCRELILARRLQMDLVDVETILGGERIVFYYLAEKRIDFRELVKDLAKAFRTRIEMKQIGVRDEAKLLADYGDCGKPVCCNTHLTDLPPVTMKMAKLQKTTLDPAKISGRCGRLKCCLRYEYDTYRELERLLPPVGARVATPDGAGRVIAHEVLVLKVVVEFDDRRRIAIDNDDVELLAPPDGPRPPGGAGDADESSIPDSPARRGSPPGTERAPDPQAINLG